MLTLILLMREWSWEPGNHTYVLFTPNQFHRKNILIRVYKLNVNGPPPLLLVNQSYSLEVTTVKIGSWAFSF